MGGFCEVHLALFVTGSAITIKNEEGKELIEIPLTWGVVGASLLPVLAAVGAIVVRQADGGVKIKETRDFDVKQGAIGGAIAGGLMGLLRGKLLAGAILGAAGGAAAGKVVDLGLEDSFLRQVADSLGPGSSAVVALVHFRAG
jgi:uncharacterized membrane protein